MKRALLAILVAAVALGAIGAVTITVTDQGGVELASVTQAAAAGPSAGCAELTPEAAKSPDQSCRDYLYQVHCQFTSRSASEQEHWKSWCEERRGLEQGSNPEVPRCTLELAAQTTEVGMRCRDYLAQTRCFNGSSSEEVMKEFCAKVAPTAGPDPRPRACTPALAHEPSEEGSSCWANLVHERCESTTGRTGTEDIEKFCAEVAAGAKPPTVNAQCNPALAGEDTPAGHACRDQLYAQECERHTTVTKEVQAFCYQVLAEREAKTRPTPTRGAETHSPEAGGSESNHNGSQPSPGAPEVMLQLGREPACNDKSELDPEVQRACALSGSVMHVFPFSSYGIDNNVAVTITDGHFWDGEAPIRSLLQWLIVGVWQGAIWVLQAVLLLLQWAFGVDPLSRSMDEVTDKVMRIFNLLGPEWRLTALAVLGAWGFWHGLVRRRFSQTLAGFGLSIVMMIGAMWIVYDPEGTVGEVAHYANEGSATILSAITTGELARPGEGMAKVQRSTFDEFVVGPWCALQFGGLEACNKPTGDGNTTRAELWLSLPANSSARGLLYKATLEGPSAIADETDKNVSGDFWDAVGDFFCIYTLRVVNSCKSWTDAFETETQEEKGIHPEKAQQFAKAKDLAAKLVQKDTSAVSLQGFDGVFTRAGLLIVIVIGIAGGTVFLIMIGVRLLTSGVVVLFLIMLAPMMLVVAAFGEAGRRRFVTWLQMLLGAGVAKLIYAVILAVFLVVLGILYHINMGPVVGTGEPAPAGPATAGASTADWLGSWILISTFSWVAVLYLPRTLALLSPDPSSEHGNGVGGMAALYGGQRVVGGAIRNLRAGAMAPLRAAPRLGRLVRRERGIGRQATERAIHGRADKELRERALGMARHEHGELNKRAEGILGADRSSVARQRISHLDKNLKRKTLPAARREKLEGQRRQAEGALRRAEGDEGWARGRMQRQGSGPYEPSEATLQERLSRRQRDVARWGEDANSWSSESNRRWAGISDAEWAKASRAEVLGNSKPMETLRQRSEATLGRDRDLLARADTNKLMSRETSRGARREWGGGTRFDRITRNPNVGRDPEFIAARKEGRRLFRRNGRENLRHRP